MRSPFFKAEKNAIENYRSSAAADWRGSKHTTKGEFAFTHNTKEKAIATGIGIVLADATDVELWHYRLCVCSKY